MYKLVINVNHSFSKDSAKCYMNKLTREERKTRKVFFEQEKDQKS